MTPVFWTGGGTRHRPQQAGVVLGNRHSTLLDNQDMVPVAVSSTEDLLKSLMRLCQLDLPVPDHTHLSRRAAAISVTIPRRPRQGAVHVVVDSTGLKIFGEGEWAKAGFREAPLPAAAAGRLCKADRGTVRRHGVGTRRTWPKVHRAVDETSKDIIGIEVTTATWGDSEILPVLLDQVEDRDPAFLLGIGVAPQDRRFVELDVHDPGAGHGVLSQMQNPAARGGEYRPRYPQGAAGVWRLRGAALGRNEARLWPSSI